jgi:Helicase associated domain
MRRKRNEISAERKARLDALGFVWDPRFEQWKEGYQNLKDFVKQNGHCQVPHGYKSADGFRLGRWVIKTRTKRNEMSAERKARLDALGFVWDPLSESWEESYLHLKNFMEEHGHCQVLRGHKTPDGYPLGDWVNNTRAKRDEMSPERKARLDALGFIWDPYFEQWEKGYQHLKTFVDEHGHCRVPQNHKSSDGYRLGQWGDCNAREAEDVRRTEGAARCARIFLGAAGRAMGRGLSASKDFRGGTWTLPSAAGL